MIITNCHTICLKECTLRSTYFSGMNLMVSNYECLPFLYNFLNFAIGHTTGIVKLVIHINQIIKAGVILR